MSFVEVAMNRSLIALAVTAIAVAVVLPSVKAQQPEGVREVIPHAQDRPPNPAKTPEEAIRAMTVPAGFTVELVASEPNLVNPVAMTFDERGRIWVTESLEYPRRQAGPGRDRVKVLEDTDGDGRADRFSVFAEGLNIPSGIAVGHGGVWVANAPDILFYPDADRDTLPDGPPQVVVTGFGRDDTHELPNSLTWGPDGWLYGWNGVFNPSAVKDHHGWTQRFTCAIFRIHPRTRAFEVWCEGTSNPWGIAINENGDFFASACVIDHLWHLTETGYYIRQGGPYPPHTWPIGSIVDHKHQKAAYCGIHWFDSPAYPPEYRGKLFMGNIHGNCVNVDSLRRVGSTYRAEPAPDFLSAHDAWFMPVVQKTGPDGCLYILDWYDRYHCYQDANRDPAGIDRLKGRLYRVRYKETPRRSGFDLASAEDARLIELLGSANIYDRDIAQRLLTERIVQKQAEPGTEAKLEALVLDQEAPAPARRHALWARLGAGPLREPFHLQLLDAAEPLLRAWGVRAAGDLGAVTAEMARRLDRLVRDPSPEVRVQSIIAARKRQHSAAIPTLLTVLAASEGDPLIPRLVWENLKDVAGPVEIARLDDWVRETQAQTSGALAELWPRVLDLAGSNPDVTGATVARLCRFGLTLGDEARPRQAMLDTLTRQIREGLIQGRRLELLRNNLSELIDGRLKDRNDPLHADLVELAGAWREPAALDELRQRLGDQKAAPDRRIEAIELLVAARDRGTVEAVMAIVGDRSAGTTDFRGRLLEALSRLDEPRVAEAVLVQLPRLEPELRPRALLLLTERPVWGRALLTAVERGQVGKEWVSLNHLRRLLASRDDQVARQVKALFGTIREGRDQQRELVVGQMRNFLAKTPGDAIAGKAVFARLCAQCHKIHGAGEDVGPDITLNGRNDFEQLISNVFDPNLVIGPAYQATTVATRDGRVLTGLLAEDNPERIVLKVQGGKQEVVPRSDIDEIKTTGVSLMPEDVEKQLTPQEIADLFAFLALDRPPEDPSARRLPGAPSPSR